MNKTEEDVCDISTEFYWYLYYDMECHETLHGSSLIVPVIRYMKLKYFV